MIAGTAYGVVLNDRDQRAGLADALHQPPYRAPPEAPVLYVKPRTCLSANGAQIRLPADLAEVEIAATLAVVFARDLCRGDDATAAAAIGAACLAIDVSEPHDSYFRPAVRERCRDGFLPIGGFAAMRDSDALEIVTTIDGVPVHRWSLARLIRPALRLAADISQFMTLGAGDMLLVGLAGDAPRAGLGADIFVSGGGLPPVHTQIVREAAR